MKPEILVVQFREKATAVEQEQSCIKRELGELVGTRFVSALDEAQVWDAPPAFLGNAQAVIFGGSGDFDFDGGRLDDDPAKKMSQVFLERLRPLLTYIFEHDVPTLGICYGHQLLGAFAGAQVKHDVIQKKTKSHRLSFVTDKDNFFLFADLPDNFEAHYGHKDVLDRIPEGSMLIMHGGETCKVAALRYKQNIYTTQFHPELRYEDIIERVKNSPGYLPEGVVAEEIFKNDPDSNKILQNFGTWVANLQ